MPLTKVSFSVIQVANNVTSTTVGNTTSIPSFTFDQNGIITSASNVTPSIANTQITGSITASQLATSLNLATNNVQVASIQSATGTPAITFAANGQMTLANTPLQLTGGGIKFPGTQVASTDANTLDDYEEGTWTPVLTNGTTNVTSYFFQGGSYVKIGKQVWITIQMSVNTVGISSGNIKITGLPFTAGEIPPTAGSTAYVINGVKYFSTTGAISLYLDRSSTELIPYFSSSYGTQMTYTDLSTGGQWWAQGYYVATA